VVQDTQATSLKDHGKSFAHFDKKIRGSRTLCTIHYIDWNQKKTLNLTSHKDLPKRPINSAANTELGYLQKMLAKTDREFTPEILDSLRPSKKMKKNEAIDPLVNEEDDDKNKDSKEKKSDIEEEN
jgi:hypothetical protein